MGRRLRRWNGAWCQRSTWLMGRQWSVGEPKGGGFGSSDNFETPVTKEERFLAPAVDTHAVIGW